MLWKAEDLTYIANVLAPGNRERSTLLRAMREDPELLDTMLADDRLFHHITDDPSQVLGISARLFFAVLIHRTREDLRGQTFTFERDNRYSVVVFDSSEVLTLLDDRSVRDYLADMLASFVRIETTTVYVRVKPGILERLKVNDFDIESLIEYSRRVDEGQKLHSYKRIGDICLFLLGVFSDYLELQRILPGAWYRSKSSKELADCGTYYYRAALRQPVPVPSPLEHALERLSTEFLTAVKPLKYVSSRYLGFVRRTVFLQ